MFEFRHADPTRRTPTYLQAYTIENLVWQLKLLPVVFAGLIAWDYVQDKRFQARVDRRLKATS